MTRTILLVALFGNALLSAQSEAAIPPEVTKVTICSSWGGLNPDAPFVTKMTLVRQGEGLTESGSISKRSGSTDLPARTIRSLDVDPLVAAVRLPPQPRIDLAEVGLKNDDLQKAIDEEWRELKFSKVPADIRKEVSAYRESLRNPGPLAEMVSRGTVTSYHTDDSPGITIDIEFADGSKISASSTSQQLAMIPWKTGAGIATFSGAIPRALSKLLPDGAANKERLDGAANSFDIRELVDGGIAESISRFQVRAFAGPAYSEVEQRFDVQGARFVEPFGDVKQPALLAGVRLRGMPKNLAIGMRLPLRRGAIARGHEADLVRIENQLRLVMSAPAMTSHIASNANINFRMADQSTIDSHMDLRTKRQFVKQMHALKRLPDLSVSSPSLRGAVLIEEGFDPIYWVVLSDRRVVRWKQFTDKPADMNTLRCAGVPSSWSVTPLSQDTDDLCFGQIYSSDGQLLP